MNSANSQHVTNVCDRIQGRSLQAQLTARLSSSSFRTGISVWVCLFALGLPAAAQWRTGYLMPREAAGQTAATIPRSEYTHVIHYAPAAAVPSLSAAARSRTINLQTVSRSATPETIPGPTFTYYVDSVNGSDSNPGTQAKPKQHLSAIPSLRPGQSVGLKRGGVWRETLNLGASGTAGNPVRYGAYGTGTPPLLTGADIIPLWTPELSKTGSYTFTAYYAAASVEPHFVSDNTTPLVRIASKASLAPGAWWWDSATKRIYTRLPGDTNPSAHTMEASRRPYIVNCNQHSFLIFDGLALTMANEEGIHAYNSDHVTIQNTTITYTTTYGVYIPAGYGLVRGSVFAHNQGYSVYYQGSNNVIDLNTISDVADLFNGQRYPQAIHNGAPDNGSVVSNNTITNVNGPDGYCHGVYMSPGTTNYKIFGNMISRINGDGIKVTGTSTVYKNTITGATEGGIVVTTNGTKQTVNTTIHHNVVHGNHRGIMEQNIGPSSVSIAIYNNVCYKNNRGTSSNELYIPDTITSLTIKNNILYADTDSNTLSSTVQKNIISTNNIHYRVKPGSFIYYAGRALDWSTWISLGRDANSVNADPQLTGPTTTFTLKADSPGIGKGAYILGISATSNPNIGAF